MLTIDSRTRSKLVWAATLLAPVVAVQGLRVVFESGPAGAAAAPAPVAAPALAPTTAAKPLTPAQQRALAWLDARAGGSPARSPMDRPDPPPPPPPGSLPESTPAQTAAAVTPVDTTPRQLALTALIADDSGHRPVALINHRLYRVGDTIATGWRVGAIDARGRTVTLAGPDGRSIALAVPAPAALREQ